MARWLLLALLLVTTLSAADLPLQPFRYHEGFEGTAPQLVVWAHNGTDPTITTLAPSEEQAAEGKRSLKLDVTFGTGHYYYLGLPLRVPVAGKLKMSAKLMLAPGSTGRIGFGYNMVYPPSPHSGCSPLATADKPGGWKTIEGDLVQLGQNGMRSVLAQWTVNLTGAETGCWLDRWSLFLLGEPGSHVVAYLDDVTIEGEVPDAKAYEAEVQGRWAGAKQAFADQVTTWRAKLAEARRLGTVPADLPAEVQPAAAAIAAADKQAEELLTKFATAGTAHPSEVAALERAMVLISNGVNTLRAMAAARRAGRPCWIAATVAPTAQRPALDGPPLGSPAADAVELAMCRGEFGCASAMAYALTDIKGLKVTASELKGPGTLPPSTVDVKLVKWWYQGDSPGIGYTPKKALVAELLVKDDRLVRVDRQAQDNYLRSGEGDTYLLSTGKDSSPLKAVQPKDAATLQPIDVPTGTTREFWLTVHVPADAAPGRYEGALTFTWEGGQATLPLRLTVRPFALAPSRLSYSIYYRGTLAPDGRGTITSEGKSEAQMRAELADMRDHGVLYPTSYQPINAQFDRVMELRREAGLPTDHFYDLGSGIVPTRQPDGLKQVQATTRKLLERLKPYGYTGVHQYGIDEATGDVLASQQAAWKAVQEAGGKTCVACYHGTFEAMGGLLNTAVFAGVPDPEEAKKWHSVGSQVFCYANPQVGVEDPSVYRRNFGLVLWQAGFDGAMDYAYQHSFGHIWDDFDDTTYRDHVFAYPTVDGVIDTIAWEGFREAVNDVRYLTTLEQAIAAAPAGKQETAKQAQAWLAALSKTTNLDAMRAAAAGWIEQLAK